MAAKKRLQIIRTACRLFAERGYYNTTMPDIAAELGMSVGNLYNYFESKEELAKEVMLTVSRWVAERLRSINEKDIPTEEKIRELVRNFFEISLQEPELIDYFLRVFLSNREVFKEGCEGFACVGEVVTEVMILLSNGVERGELRNQDFFSAFVTVMGPMGGIVFLHGEGVLEKPLMDYAEPIAENIWNALKV
ncbi:TetR family transcriptional regulator [Hydrogenivirga caldilitoris]|uniref:TetR family transcriptional regulator n=1 Tax=Hydrogenivirga caldilitoris TaxID=246264 RepID=A0A497XPB4_9AQUI|nr:TetR/AcrR family transcriptional regulator [Hydrogenivirga caldilitoris]RLJ70785.1 TetR family transcriptional regulator [Hydrogenivirga caldilitoris]